MKYNDNRTPQKRPPMLVWAASDIELTDAYNEHHKMRMPCPLPDRLKDEASSLFMTAFRAEREPKKELPKPYRPISALPTEAQLRRKLATESTTA